MPHFVGATGYQKDGQRSYHRKQTKTKKQVRTQGEGAETQVEKQEQCMGRGCRRGLAEYGQQT